MVRPWWEHQEAARLQTSLFACWLSVFIQGHLSNSMNRSLTGTDTHIPIYNKHTITYDWFLGAAAARSAVNRQVAGSIPAGTASQIVIFLALIVEWYNRSLPTIWPGFDSRSTHLFLSLIMGVIHMKMMYFWTPGQLGMSRHRQRMNESYGKVVFFNDSFFFVISLLHEVLIHWGTGNHIPIYNKQT